MVQLQHWLKYIGDATVDIKSSRFTHVKGHSCGCFHHFLTEYFHLKHVSFSYKKIRRDKRTRQYHLHSKKLHILWLPAQLNALLFLEVFGDQTTFYQPEPESSNHKPHPLVWQRYSRAHASVTAIELVIAVKTLVVK